MPLGIILGYMPRRKETEMKKKRCYALAEYMEAAGWSADPRDRVAACQVAAAQGLSSP